MAKPHPIIYLTAGEVIAFNREILRRAGQSSMLLRERGLLESAVQRPQHAAYYAGADIVTQAALYQRNRLSASAFRHGGESRVAVRRPTYPTA